MTIRDEQAENNLRTIGKALSCSARKSSEAETPLKYQHRRRQSNFFDVQVNREVSTQNGRSRQSQIKHSRCLLTEITNSQDNEKSESQHSSQSLDQVNFGTQPDERIESFEDYELGNKNE